MASVIIARTRVKGGSEADSSEDETGGVVVLWPNAVAPRLAPWANEMPPRRAEKGPPW